MDFQIQHINYGPAKPYNFIEEGKEEHFAKHIAEVARKGAALGDCGKMCSDCAFKHPQPPTQDYYDAVDGAMAVLVMGGKFNCHTEDHEDAGRECVGYAYCKQYMDSIED